MVIDLLMLLIGISIGLFVIILWLDTRWKIALPLVMVNLIFITVIVYAFWDVEWLYITPAGNPLMYSTEDYSVYSYVFVGFWFIHLLLFMKCAYDSWQEAAQTKGRFSYRLQAKENRRNRRWDYQK